MMALGRSIAKSGVNIRLEHVHKQLLQLLKALLPLQIQRLIVIVMFSLDEQSLGKKHIVF